MSLRSCPKIDDLLSDVRFKRILKFDLKFNEEIEDIFWMASTYLFKTTL